MSSGRDIQLLVAVFTTPGGGRRGLSRLRVAAASGLLRIQQTAVVARDRTSGTVRLFEERPETDTDKEQPYPGAARTLTGVASPCSPLLSELIAIFLGPALGILGDHSRQREDLRRAGRHLELGGSAMGAILEECLVARLKAGQRGRYELLDCTAEASEVAAFEIRLRD